MNQPDRSLTTINASDPFAMRYWARQLRVSEADLRKAIAAVGTDTQAVRTYMGAASATSELGQDTHGTARMRRHGG